MLPADGKRFHEISQTHGPNEIKISHRGRERAWLLNEVTSYSKLERGAARGSLHRLVRPCDHLVRVPNQTFFCGRRPR